MNGPTEESRLVARAKAGDLEAFEELVRQNQRPLFSYIYRMCGNPAEAEELTQAALVRAWLSLKGFRQESSFKTWLYRIGTNLCINRLKRTRPTEELTELLPAPSINEPAEEHRARVRTELVQAALNQLPPVQRTALVLLVYDGLSYQEIGKALNKSVRAVDSLLVRAKTNLRKVLAPVRKKGLI
ncbi:MAG: RNA polymerase sigma factor [candidate division WOR-3 bacterium]